MNTELRDHWCGEIKSSDLGKKVRVAGWVSRFRRHGAIAFLDLRDRSGIIQLTMNEKTLNADLRNEWVIAVTGVVRLRSEANPKLATGAFEIEVAELKVLNHAETTPFLIQDETDALEDTRLESRYLDLRRPILQKRLKTRAEIIKYAHEFFDNEGFWEIETPILNLATPEGARDYLVPSRLHHGSFYALPQSPQLFKQLLMIGGLERYYQIAKCFRDEDLRSDRQPEFTQIDVEASFLNQEEILDIGERFIAGLFKKILNIDLERPFYRLPYWEALDRYGSDKPDLRYELLIEDYRDVFAGIDFPPFVQKTYIRGLKIKDGAHLLSRKLLEKLENESKKLGLEHLYTLKYIDQHFEGTLGKIVTPSLGEKLLARGIQENDLLIIGAHDDRRTISFGLGAVRTYWAREQHLYDKNKHAVLWITDFPMFDPVFEDGKQKWKAEHHPFTRPRDEDLKYLDNDPSRVLAYAYDIVIDGYEAGGGTLRIYQEELQDKIFRLLGLDEEEVQRRFGWFLKAFRYGTPPHGGFALGLDRLAMILTGTENIKDVIAFPKNLTASDPMSKAPGAVDPQALKDLGIGILNE